MNTKSDNLGVPIPTTSKEIRMLDFEECFLTSGKHPAVTASVAFAGAHGRRRDAQHPGCCTHMQPLLTLKSIPKHPESSVWSSCCESLNARTRTCSFLRNPRSTNDSLGDQT